MYYEALSNPIDQMGKLLQNKPSNFSDKFFTCITIYSSSEQIILTFIPCLYTMALKTLLGGGGETFEDWLA